MADALVSRVLEQLASTFAREIRQEVRRVVGLRKEVEKLESTLRTIKAVLVDAEKRQVTDEVVTIWLEMLKHTSYEIDDVLDVWGTSILKLQIEGVVNAPFPPKRKICSFFTSPCFCFNRIVMHHDIARKIKGIRGRLDVIASEKDAYDFKSITSTEEPERQKTTSFVDVSEVYGRAHDKETILRELLCGSSQEERDLHIISIVGLGGMGKTTLAQLAYNDDGVKAHFEERIWVCATEPFDETRIARAIAKALNGGDPSSLEWEYLPQHIHESIAGKKFFLVLDDVWTEDFKKWESLKHCLKSGAQGSRTLVTTRKENVAKMMGTTYTHRLGELSDEVCQSLFFHIAFFGRSNEDQEKLVETGRKIADKCKGLPLAVKTLGSLMRFRENEQEWQDVLDSEIWEHEDVEKCLFPPLLLSYFDLPSALKRCFSYCAIFPKEYVIKTNKLIQLWMAQGYLSSKRNTEMEMTGREYFQNLVMRSFFQDLEKDEDGRILSCKVHDIVHYFAQYLSKNECFIMEVDVGKDLSMDSSYRKGRHSTVIPATAPFPVSIYNAHNLRTLLVLPSYDSKVYAALPDLFQRLKCLRALDLSFHKLQLLPKEVRNLIHLRYLNLSNNQFEMLPETVCDLCNLLILDLTSCVYLKELPKGMGKLINLRHLHIDETPLLKFMPKEIGRLHSLRTLSRFIVGGDDEREACKLEDLTNLNNLQGRLKLEGLVNVADAREAKKAELIRRKRIIGLDLKFSLAVKAKGGMDELIEALQPHPNLESLAIRNYGGSLLPNWMMSLNKLRRLEVRTCYHILRLPPLWKLPSLESLAISDTSSLKKVGVEFLGLETNKNGGTSGKGDTGEASALIAFPKLKELSLGWMDCEEWDEMITRGKNEEGIRIMPCLSSLSIEHCPNLKAIPDHFLTLPLESLEIKYCPVLTQRYQRGIGEDWTKISRIPNIDIDN